MRSWRRSPAPAATPTPSAPGCPGREAHRRRAPRRRGGRSHHPERRRLARPDRGRGPTCRGAAALKLWSDAADTWERLERPPLAVARRWRQAEALVAAGASRAEASGPPRQAHAVAARIGAKPLAGQLELLAQRAAGARAAGWGSPTGSKALRRSSA